MPTQLSSKLGSDNSIFGLKEYANIKKSKFDFSKKNYFTGDIGSIMPVDWFNVFPGDKVKVNIRYLLDTFPLEVPPFTSYYIRTHWYYIKNSALWKGWNTFITRGRSGNIDLEIPSISKANLISSYQDSNEKYINLSCPNSLMNYLGLKPYYYNNDGTKSSFLPYLKADSDSFATTGYEYVDKISALPFMAYQKIVRYNYMPSNLLQDNHVWFPEDLEDHWYIDYSGSNLSGRLFVPESATMPVSDIVRNFVPSADSDSMDNVVDLCQLRYALYGDDYFTTAKPWLVRGTETTMDSTASLSSLQALFDSVVGSLNVSDSNMLPTDSTFSSTDANFVGVVPYTKGETSNVGFAPRASDGTVINNEINRENVRKALAGLKFSYSDFPTDRVPVNIGLTANTLRNLLSLSVWQERNTLCDGSYNKVIQVHWNKKPRAPEFSPMYLGGTSDLVSFGQVVQQSSSVSGSPLGTKAGVGQANNGSEVFSFDADDYGIIMGVMIISPDVVYSQGVGHEWTDLTFDEQFQPEFANLGYQPITNKELFVSGVEAIDDDLFGYQTRYAYLKQRRNTTSGLFDLTPSQDSVFGPYVQARRFSSLPELSNQFVTMSPDNIDRSFLSFENLPAFKVQFASDVSLIRALPYQSTPETFGF